jgi:2-methylisocitrate lyase-like PEP mutase family enzyme
MSGTASKAAVMRKLLGEGKTIVSPGAYDGYSVRLIEQMGFKAVSSTGSGLANSALGVPDVGIMDLSANVEACRRLARAVSIPLMADADTGYGNAVTVAFTVQYFEDAGVVGINLEDQQSPKRCGQLRGKEVIETAEMAKKIESAVNARRDPDFLIVARTDAIAVEGIDAAIARLREYAAAGADMVYPDGVASEDDVARIVEAVRVPVSVGIGFGIRARAQAATFSIPALQRLGVARVCVPRLLPGAAIAAMKVVLRLLEETSRTGETMNREDLVAGMPEITELMGYGKIEALEMKYSSESELQRRYAGVDSRRLLA